MAEESNQAQELLNEINGQKSDNKITVNYGRNPLVNYNFMLRIEALYDIPCKSVHTFTKENEYEYIQEGGLNDYVHMRRKPISKPFTFQVERYVGTDYWDPMPNGAELILPVLLMVSRYQDDFGKTKRCFVFTGCTVISKEYGALDAEKSGLLLETTTIAYREMICVDWPADIDKIKWEFNGTAKAGNGKQSAAKAQKPELTKTQMTGTERQDINLKNGYRKWSFNGTTKAGQGTSSANSNYKTTLKAGQKTYSELTKEQMKAKAVKWEFSDKSKEGKGARRANGSNVTPEQGSTELSKEKMQEKASKWEFNQNLKVGNGKLHASIDYKTKNRDYMDVPKATMEKKAKRWKFNNKRMVGKGPRSATIDRDEVRLEDMQEAARKWEFEDDSKVGQGERSAHFDRTEAKRRSMEARAVRWKFDDQNKNGSGTRSAKTNESGTYYTPSNQVTQRKYNPQTGANTSARHYQQGTAPVQRKWPDERSAMTLLKFLRSRKE